jgi:RNA-directed DNA polymerase
VSSGGQAAVRPLERPLGAPGDEAATGTRGEDAPGEEGGFLERVLAAGNRRRAPHQGRRHPGAPGLDGMTGDDLGAYRKTHGPTIRAALVAGPEAPPPVRRTAIPTPGGGPRTLGIPAALARCREHALWPVLPQAGDPTVSGRRDGVRPPRRAHQAVGPAPAAIRAGDTWVGDLDRDQCCDRGTHDGWRSRVRRRVQDRRVVTLTHRFLKAGVRTLEGRVAPTAAGPPPGGPRAPRRANRRPDAFDQGREPRGHGQSGAL